MRADVKAELQMLRELTWFLLIHPLHFHDGKCYFCQDPLLIPPAQELKWGHRRHPRVGMDITLHHINEDREDNRPENIGLCHDSCHRSYHAKKRAAFRKEVIKQHGKLQEEKVNQERQTDASQEVLNPPGGLHE